MGPRGGAALRAERLDGGPAYCARDRPGAGSGRAAEPGGGRGDCCVGVDGGGADGVVSCGMASSSPTVDPQSAVARGRSLASRGGRAIVALALLELGLLLLVLPWAGVWRHNYFLQNWAWLRGWPLSPYVRGAVTGWGLINLWLGTGELIRLPR